MCRELTPWRFIVNCLFVTGGAPIKMDTNFWQYTSIASRMIKEKLKNVEVHDDHYSLEDVLRHKKIFLKINKKTRTVALEARVTKKTLSDVVNNIMDDDIKKELPKLMKKAYNKYSEAYA